MLGAQHRGDSI